SNRRHDARGFHHMDGSQDVCFKRWYRLLGGGANQRLGGKMKDYLRRELRHRVAHCDLIADITANTGHLPLEVAQLGEIRRCVRRQREACGSRTEPTQPHAQPSALETGVAGDQHPFVSPEFYVGIDRSVSRLRARSAVQRPRALGSKFMCGVEKSSLA